MMFDQLLKRHSLGRPHDRDIEEPVMIVKAEKPDRRHIGPRTEDPTLPFRLTQMQAEALDAIITHGCEPAAAQVLGINKGSLNDRALSAYRKIPGPHRLAKLILWARARGLHKDAAEC